jgi:PRTRC genetic system protein B
MKTMVDLGGTAPMSLTGAVLLYQGGKHCFATYHPARQTESGTPVLDAGQPLTTAFLKTLAGELGYRVTPEILPEAVLARTPDLLVWWTPARRRPLFFPEHLAAAAPLSGKVFPQPPLVFKVSGRELWIRALEENARPEPTTRLKTAPYWNCAESGQICQGSMRSPDVGTNLQAMQSWERAFFQSEFTHAYGAVRITSHRDGSLGLWQALSNTEGPFPAQYLTDARETLAQFVERRGSQ